MSCIRLEFIVNTFHLLEIFSDIKDQASKEAGSSAAMAAANEQLCLTWSDFSNATWDMLRNLLLRGELADVTLVADDGRLIRTHKFMLKSCSRFFQSLLTVADQQNPIIFLTNIRLKEIQNILKFIYLGQVFLEEADLNLFMTAAEKLQIKGLSSSCTSQQLRQQSTDKSLGTADLSEAVENSTVMTGSQQEIRDRREDSKEPLATMVKDELFSLMKDEAAARPNPSLATFPGEVIVNDSPGEVQQVAGNLELLLNRDYNEVRGASLPDSRLNTSVVSAAYHYCGQCDYKSIKLFNVKKHKAAVHDGVRYPCDQCDYKATETGHLKKHKRSKHASKQ